MSYLESGGSKVPVHLTPKMFPATNASPEHTQWEEVYAMTENKNINFNNIINSYVLHVKWTHDRDVVFKYLISERISIKFDIYGLWEPG
jgi:hypothetical protein